MGVTYHRGGDVEQGAHHTRHEQPFPSEQRLHAEDADNLVTIDRYDSSTGARAGIGDDRMTKPTRDDAVVVGLPTYFCYCSLCSLQTVPISAAYPEIHSH